MLDASKEIESPARVSAEELKDIGSQLNVLCRGKDSIGGLALLQELQRKKIIVPPDYTEKMMYLLSFLDEEHHVVNYFQHLLEQKLGLRESHCSILISSFARRGKPELALEVCALACS